MNDKIHKIHRDVLDIPDMTDVQIMTDWSIFREGMDIDCLDRDDKHAHEPMRSVIREVLDTYCDSDLTSGEARRTIAEIIAKKINDEGLSELAFCKGWESAYKRQVLEL